jgi:hypothetical protein
VAWPSVNDRVVLHGRVDEVDGNSVYVELDDAQCITSSTYPKALVRTDLTTLTPELTGHVVLQNLWRGTLVADNVMLIGRVIAQDRGLALVEFAGTAPKSGRRLLFQQEALMFGQTREPDLTNET